MIRDVEAAWARLLALVPRLAARDPGVAGPDRDLAAFVAAHPGALEARWLAGLPHLAAAPGSAEHGYPTALAVLFDVRPPLGPGEKAPIWPEARLDETLRAVDPVAMLALHDRARRDHLEALGPLAVLNGVNAAAYHAGRAGIDAVRRAPIAPELRDHVCALAFGTPLPDILPAEGVREMGADEIERRLAGYLGTSADAFAARLRAGGGTRGVFLADGDRLGEVVLEDARTLHALGVDRHALADRLDSLVDVRKAPGYRSGRLDVRLSSFCGHQHDPFHTGDAYGVHRRGATDFEVVDAALPAPNAIRGGDLLIVLIRRACFFEGRVSYRLDPALAARVLGLASPPA